MHAFVFHISNKSVNLIAVSHILSVFYLQQKELHEQLC
uniref:Uncharacterized protein n=1 Tax=Anguilla anguilla TaxID=7936 RepID=A0A0E9QSJ7_ANGAN